MKKKVALSVLALLAVGAIAVAYAVSGEGSGPTATAPDSTSSTTTTTPGVAPGARAGAQCDLEGDTVAITRCYRKVQSSLERQLEDVLAGLEGKLVALETAPDGENPAAASLSEIRGDLANAQTAWERYRDTVCNAAVLYSAGGTIQNVVGPRCDVALLDERIHLLKDTFSL